MTEPIHNALQAKLEAELADARAEFRGKSKVLEAENAKLRGLLADHVICPTCGSNDWHDTNKGLICKGCQYGRPKPLEASDE